MQTGTLVRTGSLDRAAASRTTLRARLWRERWMYLFLLPGLVYFIVFRYVPLLGNVIAFQDYSPFLGFDSPWVGLDNFATGHRRNLSEVLASVSPEQAARFRFLEGVTSAHHDTSHHQNEADKLSVFVAN